MAKCPACGNIVNNKDMFCRECGSILDFDLKDTGINNTHLCESHSGRSYSYTTNLKKRSLNYKKEKTGTAKLKVILLVILFTVLSFIALMGTIVFENIDNFDFLFEETSYYESYEIEELYNLFPEYSDSLTDLELWANDVIKMMNAYNIAPYMPYYSMDTESDTLLCIIEANYKQSSYFCIQYDSLSKSCWVSFSGDERGQHFEDIRLDLEDYPIVENCAGKMVDLSLYGEALNSYDENLSLEDQYLEVYTPLTNSSYDSCIIYVNEDHLGYYIEVELCHVVE